MKRVLKIFTSAVVILAVCFSVFAMNTFAASNTTLAFSKSSVTVGDSVSVSVTLSVPNMYATDLRINYDNNILTYVSGASSGGAGIVNIVEALSGESQKTFTVEFKAAQAGSCTVSVTGSVGYQETTDAMAEEVAIDGASATLSVNDVTLSSNANLKSLRLSAGSLSPRFSASTTSYTANVQKSVTDCKIYATTADPDAKVAISGSSALNIGANQRTITVTAPSGAQKVYTVTINRSDVDEVEEKTEAEKALETIIDGATYSVVADISAAKLPTGFNVAKKLYNGQDISIATDDNKTYEIYYLKSATGDELIPYTFDETANTFKKLQIITQGENSYIVAEVPSDYVIPEGYFATNETIAGMDIKCYASTTPELSDMYYIYCFFDGKFAMYRYDNVEKVLQRSPEFKLAIAEKTDTQVDDSDGFFARFNKLSGNAKTIVVCLCVAFLGVIALIVLLIIKFVRGRNYEDYDMYEDDEDFDSIEFNENFEIVSGEEPEDEDE